MRAANINNVCYRFDMRAANINNICYRFDMRAANINDGYVDKMRSDRLPDVVSKTILLLILRQKHHISTSFDLQPA